MHCEAYIGYPFDEKFALYFADGSYISTFGDGTIDRDALDTNDASHSEC